MAGFGACSKTLAAELLMQGCRCHGLRWTFSGFCRRRCGFVSGFRIAFGSLLQQSLSEPEFYGDLVYKLKNIISWADVFISS